MSNRSKKNIFVKEANDTLKRVIISPELRNQIMELITGTKPKNGQDSLKWSLEHNKYLIAENKITDDVAEYITNKRQELYAEAVSWNSNALARSTNKLGHTVPESKTQINNEDWRMKAKERDRLIISADVFDEYWIEKEAIEKELKKYTKISKLYSEHIQTGKIVDEYAYCVLRVIQHKYGSPLGVKTFGIDNYKAILKLYEQYKNEYNLTYPGFPEELLVNQVRIPDEPIRPHKET